MASAVAWVIGAFSSTYTRKSGALSLPALGAELPQPTDT